MKMEEMTIDEKLMYIQTELKVPKSQFNKFGGYKYRSLEDILEAVKPLLKKYKCHLKLSDEIISVADRIYVKATATLADENAQIQVSAYAREQLVKKGMDEAQITGAASSYARKYALNGLFAIDDTKDADTQNNTDLNNVKLSEMAPDVREKIINAIKKVAPDYEINMDLTYEQAKKAYAKLRKGQTK